MPERLNIAEMGGGAFMEQFHIELSKVLANIKDPNTDPKAARKITLTATLKPDENREVVSFSVQCKPTLAPVKPVSTLIMVGRDGEKVVGAELKSKVKDQMFIDTDGRVKDDVGRNVVDFNNEKARG